MWGGGKDRIDKKGEFVRSGSCWHIDPNMGGEENRSAGNASDSKHDNRHGTRGSPRRDAFFAG